MASVLSVRKKGCCYRIIARDVWGELMGPGSCVGGDLSKIVEFIDRYILKGAPEGEVVDIKSSGRRKVSLSKGG